MSSDTSAPSDTPRDNPLGMAWGMFSMVMASTMAVAVRGVTLELDSRTAVLLRSGIALLALTVALVLIKSLRQKLTFSVPMGHIIRGVLMAISMHLGFYTIANIPLATATELFFTAPIFATLFAALFQGEKVGPRRLGAVAAGFIGALVILRPGLGPVHPAFLTGIGSAIRFAAALSLSRRVATADGAFAATFSSIVITFLISLPLVQGSFALPSQTWTWVALLTLVVAGTLRNFADIEAYRLGEAAILAPLAYLRLILIGLAGYVLFDETIDGPTALGAVIIISATLYIAHRQAQLNRRT